MVDLGKLKSEQIKLAKRILTKDDFDDIKYVAGCDAVYTKDKIIYAMVVFSFPDMEVKESKYSVMDVNIPPLADFFSFREAPAAVETYHKLEIDPDVLIVKGNGILHPRKIGVASHLGLMIDKPTIGVGKESANGDIEEDDVYLHKALVAKIMKTKDHANPIYISPGHKVALQSAMDIISKVSSDKKMPIPIHEARKYANRIKKRIS